VNKLISVTSFVVIHVSKRVLNSNMLHDEQTNTNIIIWRELCFHPYLAQIVCRSTNQTYYKWFGHLLPIVSTGKPQVLLIKEGETSTPFTSFPVFRVWKRGFSSTVLHVEQIYTNIIIWKGSRFQPLFSTNVLR
jgi:hypothetical protein